MKGETISAITTVVSLPQVFINDNTQKRTVWYDQLKVRSRLLLLSGQFKHFELQDARELDAWNNSVERSIPEQRLERLAKCNKQKGILLIVDTPSSVASHNMPRYNVLLI